jgi:predicted lysophospholipase L1 biosynthesis ABC-type transport system permease subunit
VLRILYVVGRQLRAVLLLSLVATYRLVRTWLYPARQVVELQQPVEGPKASSAASLEGQRSQGPSSTVERTSCFVAFVPVTSFVVAVVAVVAVASRTCYTEFDAAVPGGTRERGRHRPQHPHAPIAIAKT